MADNKDNNSQSTDNTVCLAEHFTRSESFRALFADGMKLVEESAGFLDGAGRKVAKTLPRTASVLYASESMRLTTRLMQLASWLLLQRAVGDGEMTRAQVLEEKKKIKLDQQASDLSGSGWDDLPDDFRGLVRRSLVLQKRVRLLDSEIYQQQTNEQPENPINAQIDLLETAFGKGIK